MKSRKVLVMALSCVFIACEEKSSNPDTTSFSFTSSKCVSQGLLKETTLDSLFTYTFNQDLVIDFTVWSNCCPDSNRFSVSHVIRTDTVIITVTDTVPDMCHCVCPYLIHAQVTNLPLNQYVVRCRFENESTCNDPIHLVTVTRGR